MQRTNFPLLRSGLGMHRELLRLPLRVRLTMIGTPSRLEWNHIQRSNRDGTANH
jgi:hypothetical protein